jgi:hypothetical protein
MHVSNRPVICQGCRHLLRSSPQNNTVVLASHGETRRVCACLRVREVGHDLGVGLQREPFLAHLCPCSCGVCACVLLAKIRAIVSFFFCFLFFGRRWETWGKFGHKQRRRRHCPHTTHPTFPSSPRMAPKAGRGTLNSLDHIA